MLFTVCLPLALISYGDEAAEFKYSLMRTPSEGSGLGHPREGEGTWQPCDSLKSKIMDVGAPGR